MRNMKPLNEPPMQPAPSEAASEPPKVKQVPKWVTGCVISIFVIGCGMLVYRQWYSEPATGEAIELKDGDIVPRSPGALARQFAPPPEGVRYNRNKDGAVVRADDVEMRVNLPAPKHELSDLSIYYVRNYMTGQQSALFAAKTRIVVDNSTAKYVGASADQRKALKAIGWPNMAVSDADRERMKALWTDFVTAKTPAAQSTAEDAMVNALRDIGDANRDKTKAIVDARCDQITSILTADQIEKFKTMGQPKSSAPKSTVAKVDAKG